MRAASARASRELLVFQRTPSSVDVRANVPIDPEWFAQIATPGWQQRWLENFTANQAGIGMAEEDLVQDGWTDLSRRIRAKIMELPRDKMTPQHMLAAYEDSDFEKMEEIRARVNAVVSEEETAERRPAVALERLSVDHDGRVVLELKQPFRDGTTHMRFALADWPRTGWLGSPRWCPDRARISPVITACLHRTADCAPASCPQPLALPAANVGTGHVRRHPAP